MNFSFLPLLVVLLLQLCLCSSKKEPVGQSVHHPVSSADSVQNNFMEQPDSLITSTQIQAWFSCNPMLDSLTRQYQDSFKIATPPQRVRYQEQFSAAQNKVCEKHGLTGGYKEYKWIFQNIGNPQNKKLVDSIIGQNSSKQ